MSRRVARPRNVLRVPRFLAVLIAVTAVVVGTVAPFELATASASVSASTSQARSLSDPAKSSIAKTSLAGFNAGNIISDAVFTNKSTMTEAQIQSFFNSKVSKCVVGKDEDGKPYVCLKDFKITSVNRVADAYCDGYTGAANESAARIIYRVAQSCDINPQVLIVMLQKEQGLVTHVWPSAWRYNIALGQGCPDTAPCDPGYIGFFHQIYGAARQMQMYMEGRWFNWYAPGNTWQIQYHPDRARCGTGPVYVANKATSALYYYTPYQPNAAAMRAGYSEGDSCSSYGNRNFYNYFTDWFGSTQGAPPVPRPTIASVDASSYVLALDPTGTLWGYPFAKSQWGVRVQLAGGLSGFTQVLPGPFRGSGHRDLIAVDAQRVAWILPGNGTTSFGAPVRLTDAWRDSVRITPAGDFSGDGVQDVFTTQPDGRLLLWRGLEDGNFRPGVEVGTGWNTIDYIAGGNDLTRDGRPDLLARRTTGELVVFRGNGQSGWSATTQVGHGWGGMDKIIVPGDFSGDGLVDVLASDTAGVLRAYHGRSDGTLNSAGQVGSGWHDIQSAVGAGVFGGVKRVRTAGAGDVDADGRRDVLAVGKSGGLKIYRGTGSGGFNGMIAVDSGWAATDQLLTMADFTGDGFRDIGRISADGTLYLYRGRSSGAYEASLEIGWGWNNFTVMASGIDYDGDGISDLLVRNSAGELLLYAGNGSGGWKADKPQIGHGWDIITRAFYVGDFDGDGGPDLLAQRADGTLWLYPTTGRGSFKSASQVGSGWAPMTAIFSPGDFNSDGKPDVLARKPTGELVLYRGDGKGGWLGQIQVGSGWHTLEALG